MYLNVKKLSETATIPTRGSEKSAGLDLYAAEEHRRKQSLEMKPERPELFVLE